MKANRFLLITLGFLFVNLFGYSQTLTFSTAVIEADNSKITVTFSSNIEKVGGGAVGNDQFIISLSNGVAELSSAAVTHTVGSGIVEIELTLSGTPTGEEVIRIEPKDGASIKIVDEDVFMGESEFITVSLVDKTPPSGYSVSINETIINLSNQAALSFTISNAEVSSTYNYSISSSGGGTNVVGSGEITTASQTVSSINVGGLNDGILTLSLTLTDPDNNVGEIQTSTVGKDATAPYVSSLTSSVGSVTNAANFEITIVFSEEVTNFIVGDISVTNGAASDLETLDNITFKATITPLAQGNVTVKVNAGVCVDLAGNSNLVSDNLIVLYDSVTSLPTLSKPSSNSYINKFIDVDFTLPEAAQTGSVRLTFTRTGGTDYAGSTHVLLFSSSFESQGNHTIQFDGSGLSSINATLESGGTSLMDGRVYSVKLEYKDYLGNPVSSVTNTNVSYDNSGPTATIDAVTPSPRSNSAGVLKVRFNKYVYTADVIYSVFSLTRNGDAIALGSSLPITPIFEMGNTDISNEFNVDITGYDSADGDYVFTLVKAGSNIHDLYGNELVSNAQTTWTVKATKPTLTYVHFQSNNTNPLFANKNDVVTLTFEASETIQNIVVTINGVTVTAVATGTPNRWTASKTMTEETPDGGLIPFTIDFKDVYNNSGDRVTSTTDGSSVTYYPNPPLLSSVSIASNNPNTSLAKVGNIITITFSSASLLQNVVVLISGQTATASGSANKKDWTATYTMQEANAEGIIPFVINFENTSGKTGEPVSATTNSSTVTFDKTKPTVTLTPSIASPTTINPFTVTANISEPTNNFNLSSITVVDATASNFIVNSSQSYTFTVTAPYDGLLSISVPADRFSDFAGNANSASSSVNIVYDGSAPEPVISTTASNPTSLSAIPIKVDFGEVVSGFTISDIVVSGGTISNFSTTNNRIFNFILNVTTPNTYTINITAGACQDMAGNTSIAAQQFSIVYSNEKPILESVTMVSNHSNTNWVRVGRRVTLNFTSNKTIYNVLVTIMGTPVVASNVGNNWTAQYIFSEDDIEGVVQFAIDFEDLAGNIGDRVTQTILSTPVVFDKTIPTFTEVRISSTGSFLPFVTTNSIATLQFTSNEDTENPTVIINGQNATSIIGGPRIWTATRVLSASELQGIVTFEVVSRDLAGNASTPATTITEGSHLIFDNIPPVISSVTVNPAKYKVGDKIEVFIKSDDDIYSPYVISVNSNTLTLADFKYLYDNIYSLSYIVKEGDDQHFAASSIPVLIQLEDFAGNRNVTVTSAVVVSGGITIDSSTPSITSVTSTTDAGAGQLIIGKSITFTVNVSNAEPGITIYPNTYNGRTLTWIESNNGATHTATYTVIENDPTQSTPLQLGEVTAIDFAGNSSAPYAYAGVAKSIFATRPTVSISGSTTKCDNGLLVPISFSFVGNAPFQLTYNNGTSNVGPIAVSGNSYSISAERGTFTLVNLVDVNQNTNSSAIQNATITVNSLPNVSFREDLNYNYNIDDVEFNLSDFATPNVPLGVYSGQGVGTNGWFYPKIVGIPNQQVDVNVTYTYTDANGCKNSDTKRFTVSSGRGTITNLEPHYCQYDEPVTILGSNPVDPPTFGRFTCSSLVGFEDLGDDRARISPKLIKAGTHTVTYIYTENSIDYEIERTFVIDSVAATIDLGSLESKYCKNSNPVNLQAVDLYPSGGIGNFSGPDGGFFSVPGSNAATFYPAELAENTNYQVNYYYQSPRGCKTSTINLPTRVNALPVIDFSLKNNYNYNQAPILLEATPADGTFSGTAVVSNKLFPNLATPGVKFSINYAYTDASTKCSSSETQSTVVYKANEVISNLNSEYCYSNDIISISCSPAFDSNIEGVFFSKKGAVTSNGKNIALYSIPTAGKGVDTVFYRYSIEGTQYEVFTRVLIDSIGPVTIEGLSSTYCNDDSQVILAGNNGNHGQGFGNFSYSGSPSAFGNIGNSAFFNPLLENHGVYNIKYTYTSSISSCKSETSLPVTIYAIPRVRFSVTQSCSDLSSEPLQFFNNTTSDVEIREWNWNFNNQGSSTEFEPSFLFLSAESKRIWLRATTINECSVQWDSTIVVGFVPKASFSWKNECLTDIPTELQSTSGLVNIAHYKWLINDEFVYQGNTTSVVNHLFSEVGSHDVKLIITSNDNCKDSITNQVYIHPLVKFNDLPSMTYYENFESDQGGWGARGYGDNRYFSWEHGTPTGNIITHAASGTGKAWFTAIDFDNQKVENSGVVSPCFDMGGLDKPMIKMNIWSAADPGRDGAVIQASLDQGVTWNNVGVPNKGINWFNATTISSRPGNQFTGWSGPQMSNWQSARYNLDFLKDQATVRFRIVYAADGNSNVNFNGFAFDDIWIGNRDQKVLLEYFTNTNVAGIKEANTHIASIESNTSKDVIPIHYHTSVPYGDPINANYSLVSSAREFYYGITSIPYALGNGVSPLDFSQTTNNQNLVEVESLKDPLFSLNLNCSNTTNVNIEVAVKANQLINDKDLALQFAIVQPIVDVGQTLQSGESVFYNVIREFIPNAGGETLQRNWSLNEEKLFNQTWQPSGNMHLNNANLVVFVQDIKTRKVLQSAMFKLDALTSNKPIDIANGIKVYPNPTTDFIVVESPQNIKSITILDITGKVVKQVATHESVEIIPVDSFSNGVYILLINVGNERVVKRFIKQ
jgi:hypothetical protein